MNDKEMIQPSTLAPKMPDQKTEVARQPTQNQKPTIMAKVISDRLNVRKKPNMEAEILAVLNKNAPVQILGNAIDGWVRIQSLENSELVGFVKREFTMET